jgi:DNA-binding response OmpR family regulator
MPRPRSILWVDDEIESLTSHVMFLEEQGFSVDTSAHGDDALVMLQRQPYGVVLLDEQMPGRRGLELFRAIRSVDQSMPVVMVTKSEEPETFKDALGAEISDYLVKPVNPRQILTVITRLLEGDRIRQQRLSRDFASRFRELEARRGAALGWREWIEFVVELAEWEVRLGQADEPGLQDALRTLQESLRQDFAKFLQRSYPGWLRDGRSDRPPLSVDIGAEFLRPALQSYGKVLLVVVDCLRLDQWAMIRPLIGELFDIETSHYFSILPTATPYARNAIFSGLFPSEIAKHYPDYWVESSPDERSKNRYERQLLDDALGRKKIELYPAPRYVKIYNTEEAGNVKRQLSSFFSIPLVSLVFNFVDILAHGRSESEILLELAPDEPAFRSLMRSWFQHSALFDILRAVSQQDAIVVLTTDHGSVIGRKATLVYGNKETSTNLRYKYGTNLGCDPKQAIHLKDPARYKLPADSLNKHYIFARENYYFVYPTKFHEYERQYKGTFQHGGVSLEEMVLPCATLTPKARG